ncbi:hypothetical protein AB9P05_08325 [Roseivirga sp. BDSF3-8]|uniref:hypothetical protein n=1 Tax=Roseivirga sp. BDSF3-8 TaxID=3241598 RepID=UPI003531B333
MTIDLLAATFSEDPYREYDRIRDAAGVYYDKAAQSFVVADYEGVNQLVGQSAISPYSYLWEVESVEAKQPLIPGESPFILASASAPKGLPGLEGIKSIIEKNSEDLLSRISSGLRFDLVRQFSSLLPYGIFADITGISRTDIPRLQHWHAAFLDMLKNIERNPDIAVNSENSRSQMRRYFDGVSEYNDRDNAPFEWSDLGERRDPALGALLMCGGMHFEEAFARYMLYLANNKAVRKEVLSNDEVALNVLREIYRCFAPRPIIMVQNHEDILLKGIEIPKSSRINLLVSAANRDETVFSAGATPEPYAESGNGPMVFTGSQFPLSNVSNEYHVYAARVSNLIAVIASRQIFTRFSDLEFPESANWVRSRSLVAQLART